MPLIISAAIQASLLWIKFCVNLLKHQITKVFCTGLYTPLPILKVRKRRRDFYLCGRVQTQSKWLPSRQGHGHIHIRFVTFHYLALLLCSEPCTDACPISRPLCQLSRGGAKTCPCVRMLWYSSRHMCPSTSPPWAYHLPGAYNMCLSESRVSRLNWNVLHSQHAAPKKPLDIVLAWTYLAGSVGTAPAAVQWKKLPSWNSYLDHIAALHDFLAFSPVAIFQLVASATDFYL